MDKDTAKLIRKVKARGWFLDGRVGSHNQEWLRCPGGCRIPIYSTPRGSQVKAVAALVARCKHGYAPDMR